MQVLFDIRRRIHFVGIGGIGMSGIAEVLLNLGYRVSGSDLVLSETTQRLAALGAQIAYGHSREHITPEIAAVVISSAVKYANPEVIRAKELRIPVIPRAEMLAELMRLKYGIAVAGTHGKTTTTSLIAEICAQAGLDPTLVVGGKLKALGSNARLGQGSLLIAEADESDGTFLLLTPTLAVVTNIDPEHLDHYGSMERVEAAYLEFINRVPFYGAAILCLDSLRVRALMGAARKRVVTYGLSPEADFYAREITLSGLSTGFEVWQGKECLGWVTLSLPGRHQALNALAAVAVAEELHIPFTTVQKALGSFAGIHRRFEIKGEALGIRVVDDYGHHPEEIRATLRAAREGFQQRLVVLFQPHRYTRTRDLLEDFLSAFDEADLVLITEIYPADEEAIEGVSGQKLYQALKKRGHLEVHFVGTREELPQAALPLLKPGDLVLTLGAGDIYRAGEDLLKLLQQKERYGS